MLDLLDLSNPDFVGNAKFFYIYKSLLRIQLHFISTNNFDLTSLWKKTSGKLQIPLDLQTHQTYSAFVYVVLEKVST